MSLTKDNNGYVAGLVIGGMILIVLFFVLCFRSVGVGQVGIVTRFGNISRQSGSGIVMKLPWPIEKLHKIDIKIQKQEQDAAAATSDLQDVNAKLAVNYAVNPEKADDVFRTIGGDYREQIIVPAVQESFKAATAQYTAGELLTKRPEVKQKALDVIKARVEPYGIRIDDVSIINFNFSPEFAKAIESKQVAAQQAEQAIYLVQKAQNEGKAVVEGAKAHAEAQNLLRQTLTPELLQKEAIAKWDGKLPTTFTGGTGTVFNIPLR